MACEVEGRFNFLGTSDGSTQEQLARELASQRLEFAKQKHVYLEQEAKQRFLDALAQDEQLFNEVVPADAEIAARRLEYATVKKDTAKAQAQTMAAITDVADAYDMYCEEYDDAEAFKRTVGARRDAERALVARSAHTLAAVAADAKTLGRLDASAAYHAQMLGVVEQLGGARIAEFGADEYRVALRAGDVEHHVRVLLEPASAAFADAVLLECVGAADADADADADAATAERFVPSSTPAVPIDDIVRQARDDNDALFFFDELRVRLEAKAARARELDALPQRCIGACDLHEEWSRVVVTFDSGAVATIALTADYPHTPARLASVDAPSAEATDADADADELARFVRQCNADVRRASTLDSLSLLVEACQARKW